MADPTETEGLTPGELEELTAERAGQAPGAAATTTAAAEVDAGAGDAGPEGETPAGQSGSPAPEAVNDGVRAMTVAAESLAKAAEAIGSQRQAAAAAEQTQVATPRDWDAERAALKARYSAGDIDEDEFETAREKLLEERADARVQEQVQAQLAQARQDASQADWERTVAAFRADSTNLRLFEDVTKQGTFSALVHVVAAENPTGSYVDWLNAARDRTFAAFGLPATAAEDASRAQQAIDKSTKDRAAAAGKAPKTVDNAPSAGAAVQAGPDASLDALGISDLEDTLARMPADKIEQYLAGAPGGLRDNPRAI